MPRQRWLFVCLAFAMAWSPVVAVEDMPYPQPMSNRLLYSSNATSGGAWPVLPLSDVVQVVALGGGACDGAGGLVVARTSDGEIWQLDPATADLSPVLLNEYLGLNTSSIAGAMLAAYPEGGQLGTTLGLASADGYWTCAWDSGFVKAASCSHVQFSFGAPVSAVQWTGTAGELYVGTLGQGLFHIAGTSAPTPQKVSAVTSSHVTAMAYLQTLNGGRLAVGTRVKAFVLNELQQWTWEWIAVPTGLLDGIVDAVPTSMAYLWDDSSLWIGNVRCVNVQHRDMTYRQLAAAQGLPFGNITAVGSASGQVWLGTSDGLIRYDSSYSLNGAPRRPWSFYRGDRWVPQGAVRSVAALQDCIGTAFGQAVVATDTGIAVVVIQAMTLQQKADHLQSIVEPRHDRFGLVSTCSLQSYGDVSSWQPEIGESDGLWTGVYLAGQCLRYAVTQDQAVHDSAWHHFEAMEFLHNVTGIPGYVARTFYQQDAPYSCSSCYNSTTYPGWAFQGDTSSDSLAGNMLVYPLVYRLLAQNDAERERVLRLVRLVTSHIVDNNFVYVGVDGQPTTWGRWNPEWIEQYENSSERGVNSLQIVSWLLSSYSMTKNETYLDAFVALADTYGYSYNIVNQKVTCLADVNYSDNENAFLPYVDYIMANTTLLEPQLTLGMQRAWEFVADAHCSLWDFIYTWHTGRTEFLKNSLETLRTWPLELVDWPVSNSNRLDVSESKYLSRSGNPQMEPPVLPYDEISYYRWNANPFELQDQGSGYAEYDPGAPLTAYWLARYLGVLE